MNNFPNLNIDYMYSINGCSLRLSGGAPLSAYAVCDQHSVIKSYKLPASLSAKAAKLTALTSSLLENKTLEMCTVTARRFWVQTSQLFCVVFECLSCASMGLLWLIWLSPTVQRHADYVKWLQ